VLLREIQDALRGTPHTFDYHLSHFSWGAESAAAQLLIDLAGEAFSVAITAIGGVVYRRLKAKRERRMDADSAGQEAKRAVATAYRVHQDTVAVEEVEPLPDGGFRVRLTTPTRRCEVDIAQKGDTFRIRVTNTEPDENGQEIPSS
jgi:hypothetical protein